MLVKMRRFYRNVSKRMTQLQNVSEALLRPQYLHTIFGLLANALVVRYCKYIFLHLENPRYKAGKEAAAAQAVLKELSLSGLFTS